jgi:uncharacterized secreted protein with C-terminal beta-propeller domain
MMKRALWMFVPAVALLILLAISAIVFPPNPETAFAGAGRAATGLVAAREPAFSGSIALYVGSPESLINGKSARIDENPAVVPFIENSRTLMPLAFVAKTLGFTVEWHEATRDVILKQEGLTLEFKLGSNIMKNNGAPIEMETAAIARNGRTVVPISYVAKAMGIHVTYDRGLIILDSEKTYSLTADKDYINALIDQLSGLPIVGSAEKFNTLMKDLAAEQKSWDYSVDDVMMESETSFSLGIALPDSARQPTPTPATAPPQSAKTADTGVMNEAMDAARGGGESGDYSTTNIQVEGVDEADIIKTDGSYIYHLSTGTLNIIQADGRGNMKQVCALDLEFQDKDFYPQDMYVDGDRLCVIGMEYVYRQPKIYDDSVRIAPPYYRGRNFVKVLVYDTSQKSAPKLHREFSAEGDLLTSRKVDNTLYLVVNYYMNFYGIDLPCEAVPLYHDSVIAKDEGPVALDFATMRYFPSNEDGSILMVCGLDIEDAQAEAKIASVLGSGGTVYMSRSALYIAKYNYFYNIMPTGGAVQVDVSDKTTFFKFALDNGYAVYQSKGLADGSVLNQYSMDEFNGCFRAAMTVSHNWDESKNALVIFDQSMEPLGKIDNMAPGERIYSARFMGERAFMVTYRTVDPLFALDLSDPRNPKVLGELKIPGYSSYLHPYDENHLIGFGRDTEELTTIDSKGTVVNVRAVNRGLKLALFDVSDMTAPKELSVVTIGNEYTDSELLYNPKCLLFSKEKGFIAFPVRHYNYNENTDDAFNGAHVYDIGPSGIKLRGVINQAEMNKKNARFWQYDVYIQRILYIGETFYSASNLGLQSNDMKSLQYIGYIKYD